MGEIKKLSELNERQLDEAIDVFIEGFYFTLKNIQKDKAKLHRLFKPSFDENLTYAYLQDGVAIGFLGLANAEKRPTKIDKETYAQVMGNFAAKTSYKSVSQIFEKPKELGKEDIFIDYIATDAEHRSKGIGTKFIEFIRDILGHEQIELETYSKNVRAIAFYERMGFGVTKRKKSFMMRLSGFGDLLTLRAGDTSQPSSS